MSNTRWLNRRGLSLKPETPLRDSFLDWTQPGAPRIFRRPESDFNADEPLQAASVYTAESLGLLVEHGFNGIWLRGRLRDLMQSNVLPGLNDSRRQERLDSLRAVIARGRAAGIGVYLFFNDPLALPAHDPFWRAHPDLAGETHRDHAGQCDSGVQNVVALCLSTPTVARFFEEAAASVLRDLPSLAGVILITASEHHSHCWSHYVRYGLDDGMTLPSVAPMRCPRCARREPAELVSQIARGWRNAADAHAPQCRVIAWNWSWSLWYRDPQREVLDALPPGVDVMADWERGGQRAWRGRTIVVDEYSLGYAGPSERFLGTRAAARQAGRAVLAKLQIGTTHEIATVPNLPLLTNLHQKLAGLHEHGIAGFMGAWNFGCTLTLNTYAIRHFLERPAEYRDRDRFLASLAQSYLGVTDPVAVIRAWEQFARDFENYPFHIQLLYFSPLNDAPAHPLSFRYTGTPLGDSWVAHAFGDRLEDCLGPFTMVEVADAFAALDRGWQEGLAGYAQALRNLAPDATAAQHQHAAEELRCAQMIDLQFRSAANLFRFHQERQRLMAERGLVAPCDLPRTEALESILCDEIRNAQDALPLVEADPRLGFHQEARVYMYDATLIRKKIAQMERELGHATH